MDSIIGLGGGSNQAELLHLRNITDFSWNNSLRDNRQIYWNTAQPVVPGASKYIYSEWALPYLATLGAAITSPTQATITISDAASAPVFAYQLIQIDDELMRVLPGVAGESVPVERGASGTIPATHGTGIGTLGSVMVFGRYNLASLDQLGGSQQQFVEYVSLTAHNLKSGQVVSADGTWPTFSFTDGSEGQGTPTGSYGGYGRVGWVTGPYTVMVTIGWATAGPVTLASTVSMGANAYSTISLPEVGLPYDAAAWIANQFPGCRLWINLPCNFSDSYAYAVANKVKEFYTNTGNIYLEVGDEPWNWGLTPLEMLGQLSQIAQPPANAGTYAFMVFRTGRLAAIFEEVMALPLQGASNLSSIHNMLAAAARATYLSYAEAQGVSIGAVVSAPYLTADTSSASVTAYGYANIQQAVDMFVHDWWYNTNGFFPLMAAISGAIAAYNSATGGNCEMGTYEGGYANGVPPACVNAYPMARDIQRDPNFYIGQQDMYNMYQRCNLSLINDYAYSIYYYYNNCWAAYSWPDQDHGRGDGSDGKINNRLCVATPGYTGPANYTKAAVDQSRH